MFMSTEDFFKGIAQHYNKQLPFVVYRKPNVEVVNAVFQTNDTIYSNNDFTEHGFVFAPFDDQEDAILFPLGKSEIKHLTAFIPGTSTKQDTGAVETSHHDSIENISARQKHITRVNNALEAINSGTLKKVVLSRPEVVPLTDTDPIKIFRKLLDNYLSAYVYCWYHPKVGLWLGATPEILLKISENKCSTMALAGTQQYHGTMDVQWDLKDKNEQQIVTDYIVEGLKPLVEQVYRGKPQTVKAGSLLHLQTLITTNLKSGSTNLKDILKVLHPTPAVCGLPKAGAKAYISHNENYNREFYTGYLGELNQDRSELYVNLRCMQLKHDNALLYIGGGITKDSIPENEWQETVDKAKIIKRVL